MRFSQYSQAADLGNGIAWYATLGVAAAVLALVAVAVVVRTRPGRARWALLLAAAGTVGQMLVMAWAAPLSFSQRAAGRRPVALVRIFDRFEALNTLRASLRVTVLLALLVGLFALSFVPDRAASRALASDT